MRSETSTVLQTGLVTAPMTNTSTSVVNSRGYRSMHACRPSTIFMQYWAKHNPGEMEESGEPDILYICI